MPFTIAERSDLAEQIDRDGFADTPAVVPQLEIDRVLADVADIVPSSGFVASVMEAVTVEAAPPLPFPWKRAFPLAAGFIALLLWLAFRQSGSQPVTQGPDLYAWFQMIVPMATGWVAAALLVTIALTIWSLRRSIVGQR